MIYDIHVHLAATGGAHGKNFISSAYREGSAYAALLERYDLPPDAGEWHVFDELIAEKTIEWLDGSQVDRAVLLAQDSAYSIEGTRDKQNVLMATESEYVAEVAEAHAKTLFGASVHPYRKDALEVLEKMIQRGACLVKWLPSAQNIQPDDPACLPYFEMLAHYQVPLLCHTGGEEVLSVYPDVYNDPSRLVPALERGVTVIAAHCGTRLSYGQRSYFDEWKKMAQNYENCYGDLSSFCVAPRLWPLGVMLETPALAAKLVFGSDFPSWTVPWTFVGQLGYSRVAELRKIQNPFDQAVETLKAAGVTHEIFDRAGKILRIPEAKQKTPPPTAVSS